MIDNPKVTIPDFLEDLVSQLENRDLRAIVVPSLNDCSVPTALTYIAFRSMGVVTKVKVALYENGERVAHIDWDGGRSPMPPKISNDTYQSVEYWQTAETLSGLFSEIEIE